MVTMDPGGTAPDPAFSSAPNEANAVKSLSNPAPATATLVDP